MQPSHDPKTVGLEIRSNRKSQGLTQDALADRAGLAVRTVRNIEAGKPVQPGSLGLVLRALGEEPAPPQFPDDIAFVVNAIGLRLMAVSAERRGELAGRLTQLLVEDALAAEADPA